ncbi:hypothetical protein DPMN_024718 [Dreissena polymorpha]|uniref:Uncharacterized protein n=1 Tax=Dreissena polymorpha TaxID=45954 RepID=A0A9D4LQA0_DREPO|nr:hypothetical protein DPMN_024718 [Dreissena polymorpha]
MCAFTSEDASYGKLGLVRWDTYRLLMVDTHGISSQRTDLLLKPSGWTCSSSSDSAVVISAAERHLRNLCHGDPCVLNCFNYITHL